MILKLIIDTAVLSAGCKIDFVAAKRYFDEAINILINLNKSAWVKECCTLTVGSSDEVYEINGLIEVIKAEKNGMRYFDFEVVSNCLKFGDEGIYEIEYYRRPQRAKLETDNFELDDSYAIAVAKYIAARIRLFENPKDELGERLLEEFYKQAELTEKRINRSKKYKTVKVPQWR